MKKSKVKRFLSVLVCLILALSVMVLPYGCSDSGGPAEGEYTITFDSMGGTEIAPITVAAGAYAEKPDNPTKDGHIFKGWYLDLSDTESGSFLFDETPITQNIQLYALWQIRTFKVSFLDDSGNEIIPSATYDWGSLLEEPDTDSLEKDGFVIKWYKENGDLWDFATSKVISNTTLTLRYISNKDSYIGKEVADNFYPTYDKIITDPEMCSETYNEDTDTVSYTYDGLNLQQVALYLELDTLEYSSVSVVARAAELRRGLRSERNVQPTPRLYQNRRRRKHLLQRRAEFRVSSRLLLHPVYGGERRPVLLFRGRRVDYVHIRSRFAEILAGCRTA